MQVDVAREAPLRVPRATWRTRSFEEAYQTRRSSMSYVRWAKARTHSFWIMSSDIQQARPISPCWASRLRSENSVFLSQPITCTRTDNRSCREEAWQAMNEEELYQGWSANSPRGWTKRFFNRIKTLVSVSAFQWQRMLNDNGTRAECHRWWCPQDEWRLSSWPYQ